MSVMEFLAMGGHGPYIWGSYGVMALLMVIEARQVIARKRKALSLQHAAGHGGRS
ncbi:MAG: heme exporter protein CcmD [Thiohalomonadaceae bacterium]